MMKMRDNFIEGQKIKETRAGVRASGWGSRRINQWIKKQFAPNCDYYVPGFVAEGPIDLWAADKAAEDLLDDYYQQDSMLSLLLVWRSWAHKWVKKQFAPNCSYYAVPDFFRKRPIDVWLTDGGRDVPEQDDNSTDQQRDRNFKPISMDEDILA